MCCSDGRNHHATEFGDRGNVGQAGAVADTDRIPFPVYDHNGRAELPTWSPAKTLLPPL